MSSNVFVILTVACALAACNTDARVVVQGQVTARLDTVNGSVNNVGFPFPNATRLDGPGASAATTGSCLISGTGDDQTSTVRFFQVGAADPRLEQVTIATRIRQNSANVTLVFGGTTYTGTCAATASRADRSLATLSMTNCTVSSSGTNFVGQVNAELSFEGCSVVSSTAP